MPTRWKENIGLHLAGIHRFSNRLIEIEFEKCDVGCVYPPDTLLTPWVVCVDVIWGTERIFMLDLQLASRFGRDEWKLQARAYH